MNETAQPIVTVQSECVALGPIRRDLVPLYHAWINDVSTARFLRMWPVSMESEYQWYESVCRDPNMAFFTIYERCGDVYRPIGGIDLHGIDRAHRTAELGVMIGESDCRGRGLGTDAIRLICDYGFNALELNSIWLLTYGWNVAGQRAYEKAGFKLFGRRRNARFFCNRWWDDVYYDLLRDEFDSPALENAIRAGIPKR